jgi:hypothetical protein
MRAALAAERRARTNVPCFDGLLECIPLAPAAGDEPAAGEYAGAAAEWPRVSPGTVFRVPFYYETAGRIEPRVLDISVAALRRDDAMIDDDFCGSSDETRRFDGDMAGVIKGWTPGSSHCPNYLRDQLRLEFVSPMPRQPLPLRSTQTRSTLTRLTLTLAPLRRPRTYSTKTNPGRRPEGARGRRKRRRASSRASKPRRWRRRASSRTSARTSTWS